MPAVIGEVPTVWAIVELMGHVKMAGKLTEEEKFGSKMGRLDIPDGDGFVTQYFSGSSIYRITIVTEDVARMVRKSNDPAPVSSWDFPKALASPQTSAEAPPWIETDEDEDDDLEHRY